MLRKLDGRVIIVGAQRVLESHILKCQLSLYKLTLCGTGVIFFLLLFMFLAADGTVLFLFSG